MKLIFNIILLLCIITLWAYWYGYYCYWIETSKDILIWLFNIIPRDIEFFREFYYYMWLWLWGFFFIFSLMMTGKIPVWFIFLLGSVCFWTIVYNVEMLRIPFIIPTLMFFWVFYFFSIVPKIKENKYKKLQQNGIHVMGKYIDTITDYSIKINNRPRQIALVEVVNPHTSVKETIQSEWSFDPYFWVNINPEVDVYFDRFDSKKYAVKIKKL